MFKLSMMMLAVDGEQIESEFDEAIKTFSNLTPQQFFQKLQDFAVDYLPKILGAVVVFIVGRFIMKILLNASKNLLRRSRIDSTLHNFILSIIKIAMYLVLLIVCLTILKIPAAPLVTVMGTAGLALSLALKDSLANIAGGISVLFNHPFRKGDLVQIKDVTGVVKAIDLVYTQIKTDDDKLIYFPNGDAAKSVVVNYSSKPLKRLDFVFYIPLNANFEEAKKTISLILVSSEYTLSQPEPIIHTLGKTEDSYSVSCKVWAREEYYDTIYTPLSDEIDRQLKALGM